MPKGIIFLQIIITSQEKSVIKPAGGIIVFKAGLGICLWLKKTENIHVLFIFPKIFLATIFLVIGVKPGKSLGMGEEI
ncbi:MAG: hypothetical protein FVQ84_21345 [Planctomycetes bacterium]|nr:hypothetical protein [Planctomycetota bacterium]